MQPSMSASMQASLAEFHARGFVILRDVLSDREIDALRARLQPYLDLELEGRNDFEGRRTRRVYSLVGRGKVFERTKKMSRRLRERIGYSIHPPFMGQLAGRHPEKSLAEGYVHSLIADDEAIQKEESSMHTSAGPAAAPAKAPARPRNT